MILHLFFRVNTLTSEIDSHLIKMPVQVFKLDWLLMSICILCIIAMGLYALIDALEKWYMKNYYK